MVLNLLLVVLFFVSQKVCWGQSASHTTKTIDCFIGVGVSDRLQTRNPNFQSRQGNSRKEPTLPGVSYITGVHVTQQGKKKFQPLFGLIVQAYGIRSKAEYPDRVKIGDTIVIQNNRQTDRMYHHYLGVPLGYRVLLSKTSEHSFFVKGGLCPEIYLFLFKKRIMRFDEIEKRQFQFSWDESFRPLACSAFVSGGIVRKVSKRLKVNAAITGNFHLISNLNSKNPFRHRWYSAGILIGVTFSP